MKWFKHDASASDDVMLQRAEDAFGDAGYAAFFKILELMRANFNYKMPGVLIIGHAQLRKKLRKRSTSTELLLNFYQQEGKLLYQIKDGKVYIQMPNFKRYMDDYTRKITAEKESKSPDIEDADVRSNFAQKRRDLKKSYTSYHGLRLQLRGSWLGNIAQDVLKKIKGKNRKGKKR